MVTEIKKAVAVYAVVAVKGETTYASPALFLAA